ncbi:hypothetical protein D9619_000609 [Psilocybe cf. subviscida]|uniref:Uncharacterized protein n=1 Tax=Psilocybe cf. subviscida TaxID=2480587 RepID=A0A8H5BG70_9AGAR|nr:hypothetical protein D9619_000609 [Psilocybe cf. subviscida]
MPPVASPAPPPAAAAAPASASGGAPSTAPSITITGPSAGSIIVPASLPPPPPPAHPDHQPASATTPSTTTSKRADKERNHHPASVAGSVSGGAPPPTASSKQGQGSFMAVGIAAGAEDAKYQTKYKELKRKVKEIDVLYERLSAVPPTSPPADRVAAPSIDGVLGHQSSSQHHSQIQQAIQQQPPQHPHYTAPPQHHRQHTPSSQQAQYTNSHPPTQPAHYAPPPPVPQSPVYAPYPGASHDVHPSSSRSARERERDMYAMPMDPAMDVPHARQLLSPRGGPLSVQPPGSATALYPPPLPSAGYEGSPPIRRRSHSGSTRSAAGPPSAGPYRSHYPAEGPMGMHSPPPPDRDIRDRERERERYERERDRDRERDSRMDRKSHGHGHYDGRERRLSNAQEYDAFYERGGPPPPPPGAMGHYGPSHSPQMSMAPQILSPHSATSAGRMHPHQRLGPGTYVNRDSRERERDRDRDSYMDDLGRDPRDARHTEVDQMRILEQQREWDMRERELRDKERERDGRRSDRDRERHRDRAERDRDRDQDYYRERDLHYRERDREYAPPSSGRGDLPPSNGTIRASPHLHPRTVSGSANNSGTASSRSRNQIDSRTGEYEHHHVPSAQPASANGAPGYYQDGYARMSRSGTPPSGEGEAHSRSDSRSRDYYERDGGRPSGRSLPSGSSYRIRRDDADYAAGGPPEIVPGHTANGSSGGGNTPAIESRKRSRTEMEMDVDGGDIDVHGNPDAGASIAAGGMGAANHSALPDAVGASSDDRSAKRYHRDHSRRRSIDALEDSRMGPS